MDIIELARIKTAIEILTQDLKAGINKYSFETATGFIDLVTGYFLSHEESATLKEYIKRIER